MIAGNRTAWRLAAGLLAGAAGLPLRALNPSASPGGNFPALADFYLTLPTGAAEDPSTIEPSVLTSTASPYQDSPYFYTGSDGAMVFFAPLDGVTTSGSTHPRSELRELISGIDNSDGTNWTVGQFSSSRLDATLAVNQLPPNTLDVGIGQIHEYDGADNPFVLLHYTNGQVHAEVLNQESGSTYANLVFSNVALNTQLSYELAVTSGGILSVTVNGSTQTLTIDPSWLTVPLYFKAGMYCLDTGTSATEGGQDSFYALTVTHVAIPPTLQGVVSQMTQGSAGSYGINLAYTATAAAPATPYPVECRGSGTLSLVLSFNKAIGSAQASLAAGTATVGTPVCSGDQVTIPLTGVANAQSLVVDIIHITGTDGSVLAAATVGLRALLGDVNGDGVVNISDINLARAASGAAVGPSNFQDDLNADGSINISDINLVRAASGTNAN